MFNDKEIEIIKSLNIDIDISSLSDDDIVLLEDQISNKLVSEGFDSNSKINTIGVICESIMDKLIKM